MERTHRKSPPAEVAVRDARMRELRSNGLSCRALAQRFGMSVSAVSMITKPCVCSSCGNTSKHCRCWS